MLVSGDDACGGRLVTGASSAVGDTAVFHPDIAASGMGCHFAGQDGQVLAVTINGAVAQAQVANVGVRLKITEQAGVQIGDGVTAAVVVAAKGNPWLSPVMAEALCLSIVGIRRIIRLADLAQRCAIGNGDGVLCRAPLTVCGRGTT